MGDVQNSKYTIQTIMCEQIWHVQILHEKISMCGK